MKYLITGNAGAGKSSVIQELKKRGFSAYDTDDIKDATILVSLRSGKRTEWPEPPIDWKYYSWDWRETELKKLLDSDTTVFVGAIVGNQKKFYDLFDKIFVLVLGAKTLKNRILTRTSKDYGKHPKQLAEILEYHKTLQPELLSEPTSMAIDATRPISKIVDEVLENI